MERMLKNMNDGMRMQDDIGNSARDGDGVHNGPNFFTGGQVNAFERMMSQNDRKRRLKQTNVFALLMQQQQQNNTQNNNVVDLRHELSIEVYEDDSFSDLSSSFSSFSINDSAPSSIDWLTDDEEQTAKGQWATNDNQVFLLNNKQQTNNKHRKRRMNNKQREWGMNGKQRKVNEQPTTTKWSY